MAVNPYQKYKNTQVETADGKKLVLMLYNGAIKFIKQAELALEEEDFEGVNNSLGRAQAIVNELMVTLDKKQGGEIANNLYSLYEYMNHRLIQANIKKDGKVMEEVLKMVEDLRDTWIQAIQSFNGGKNNFDQNNQAPKNYGGVNSSQGKQLKSAGISFEG